jgi:CspA family cold shock protein
MKRQFPHAYLTIPHWAMGARGQVDNIAPSAPTIDHAVLSQLIYRAVGTWPVHDSEGTCEQACALGPPQLEPDDDNGGDPASVGDGSGLTGSWSVGELELGSSCPAARELSPEEYICGLSWALGLTTHATADPRITFLPGKAPPALELARHCQLRGQRGGVGHSSATGWEDGTATGDAANHPAEAEIEVEQMAVMSWRQRLAAFLCGSSVVQEAGTGSEHRAPLPSAAPAAEASRIGDGGDGAQTAGPSSQQVGGSCEAYTVGLLTLPLDAAAALLPRWLEPLVTALQRQRAAEEQALERTSHHHQQPAVMRQDNRTQQQQQYGTFDLLPDDDNPETTVCLGVMPQQVSSQRPHDGNAGGDDTAAAVGAGIGAARDSEAVSDDEEKGEALPVMSPPDDEDENAWADGVEWQSGRVTKWVTDKGFGFIRPCEGAGGQEEVFVHQSVIRATGYRYLQVGEKVEFAAGVCLSLCLSVCLCHPLPSCLLAPACLRPCPV